MSGITASSLPFPAFNSRDVAATLAFLAAAAGACPPDAAARDIELTPLPAGDPHPASPRTADAARRPDATMVAARAAPLGVMAVARGIVVSDLL